MKAQYAADTAPFYIVFGIVISLLFLAFMWILAYYSTDISKIPDGVEYDIITQRFLSSNCFGYMTTDLKLPEKNTLDWNRFTKENLDYCYSTTISTQPQFALKLKLETPPRESDEIKTNYWSDNIGFDKQESKKVPVYYEGKIRQGQLIISTQWEFVRFK